MYQSDVALQMQCAASNSVQLAVAAAVQASLKPMHDASGQLLLGLAYLAAVDGRALEACHEIVLT